MNTILVWLLISLPASGTSQTGIAPASVVERFESAPECERVAYYITANRKEGYATPRVGCIQARVVAAK